METETNEIKQFKIVLNETNNLTCNIKTLSEFNLEAKFKLDSDGLYCLVMDSSNISMHEFKLYSNACIEYKLSEPFSFGINLKSFYEILKTLKNSDMLKIYIEDNNLILEIVNKFSIIHKIPLLDIEYLKDQKMPELKFNTNIELEPITLKDILKVFKCSESIKFNVTPGLINFESNNINVPIKDIKINTQESFITKYSAKYLYQLLNSRSNKTLKSESDLNISFNKDYPLKLVFNYPDKYVYRFILAPKIDND